MAKSMSSLRVIVRAMVPLTLAGVVGSRAFS
jgi:hypothetical protein